MNNFDPFDSVEDYPTNQRCFGEDFEQIGFNQLNENFIQEYPLQEGDLRSGVFSTQFQLTPDVQINKEIQNSCPSTLFEALKCYYGKSGLKNSGSQRTIPPIKHANAAAGQGLSTQEIIKISVESFAKSSTQTIDVAFMLDNPFHHSFRDLPNDDYENLKLVELLLDSADKACNQQYRHAGESLDQIETFSSSSGNAIQRVVYHFSKALRERIGHETGITIIKRRDSEKLRFSNFDEDIMASVSAVVACHARVPFSQVAYFAAIQTIIENVSKKIHIVDLGIRTGVQWTVLMQALVSQSNGPLELLKITAICTNQTHLVEQTGKRLETFARTMNIPFQFKLIKLSDTMNLEKIMFELGTDEEVVVHSGFLLCSLFSMPERLDSVMEVIRNLNPKLMVVVHPEIDASGSFVNRFTEALKYFGAYFDCLEACMGGHDPERLILECSHIADVIRIVVGPEGEQRKSQSAKLDFSRPLFARFGMEEMEIGAMSLYHANLVVEKFERWNPCNVEMDGKSLIIGWKGTPMKSLSAWRFRSN